jgi:hypothetical protein
LLLSSWDRFTSKRIAARHIPGTEADSKAFDWQIARGCLRALQGWDSVVAPNKAAWPFTIYFGGKHMTDEQAVTMYDAFEYVWEVGEQSRRIIQDTVEALRKETKCYFKHMEALDYMWRPRNHHFLETRFATPRVWVTFAPEGALSLAILFYIQFYSEKHYITPALMYGSLDPGMGKGFDEVEKWASWGVIRDVEKGGR